MWSIVMASTLAAVPTAAGVGSRRWGSAPPDEYDWCASPFVYAQPPETLVGVDADMSLVGYPLGALEIVMWELEGLERGQAARAALTRQFGAPYEPYRGDLYWTVAGGAVSIRMIEWGDGSARVAAVNTRLLARHRLSVDAGVEPVWWEITEADARWVMGLAPAPDWSGDSISCVDPDAPPPNTSATTFEETMRRLNEYTQRAPPEPGLADAPLALEGAMQRVHVECDGLVHAASSPTCVAALQDLPSYAQVRTAASCRRLSLPMDCWKAGP